jgi:hypothetical protein
MPVPYSDMLAAALQTKPADLASVRGCHVCNDTAHHNVLDALAVWTRHGTDLLAEESSAFVHLGFVATLATAIFEFPSHFFTESSMTLRELINSVEDGRYQSPANLLL